MKNGTSDFSLSIWIWQSLILVVIGLWIYCLVDIFKHQFPNNEKTIWFLVVLLLPMVGPLFYFLFGRKNRILKD